MKTLTKSIMREVYVEGRSAILCITGEKMALFYSREDAAKWLRQQVKVFA
tara:strand:+ start:1959 stop:2108 length:150 start_codon:yes stop_codon:yes gene_type:complete